MPRHRAPPFDWRAADIGRVRARHALRPVFLLLAALTALALFFSASAGAYVYWANYTSGATIGRANLNGTGANQSFISGASQPEGVAVDAAHIYWANAGTNTIGRASLDGGEVNQSFITGANRPEGVAVDAAHIYWTNFNGGTIGRANLNGTGANQSFITGANGPSGVAVNGAHVYWTNGVPAGTIGRSDLDGENPVQTFIIGTDYPFGLAVDAANIYWTNAGTNTIGRANLDGGSPNPSFISGPNDSYGVAVDSGHIYWGEYGGNGNDDRAGRARRQSDRTQLHHRCQRADGGGGRLPAAASFPFHFPFSISISTATALEQVHDHAEGHLRAELLGDPGKAHRRKRRFRDRRRCPCGWSVATRRNREPGAQAPG